MRIRSVKPEFWGDEKLAPLAPIHRLVFMGLISMADDAGRLVDNVKSIDGFVFPETDDSSRDSLDILARLGRIERYVSESGQRLIQIANWKRHQKVDKPSKYTLPGPSRVTRESREDVANVSRSDLDLGSTILDQDQRADKDLEQLEPPRDEPEPPAAAPQPEPQQLAPIEWPPEAVDFGRRFYPRGTATDRRRSDVTTQINGVLNGGCAFRGEVVRATPDRLAAKCREVLAEGVEKPDRAIVVLLTKLGDLSDDSPTERAAAQARDEFSDDSALITAWLAEHPEDARAIRTKMEKLLKGATPSVIDSCIAGEVRKRIHGLPDLLPHAPTTAGGP